MAALGARAKVASRALALAGTDTKNAALLAAADLAAGRLVKPFGDAVSVDFAYFIVCPEAKLALRKVSLFCDWLRGEASA